MKLPVSGECTILRSSSRMNSAERFLQPAQSLRSSHVSQPACPRVNSCMSIGKEEHHLTILDSLEIHIPSQEVRLGPPGAYINSLQSPYLRRYDWIPRDFRDETTIGKGAATFERGPIIIYLGPGNGRDHEIPSHWVCPSKPVTVGKQAAMFKHFRGRASLTISVHCYRQWDNDMPKVFWKSSPRTCHPRLLGSFST